MKAKISSSNQLAKFETFIFKRPSTILIKRLLQIFSITVMLEGSQKHQFLKGHNFKSTVLCLYQFAQCNLIYKLTKFHENLRPWVAQPDQVDKE